MTRVASPAVNAEAMTNTAIELISEIRERLQRLEDLVTPPKTIAEHVEDVISERAQDI